DAVYLDSTLPPPPHPLYLLNQLPDQRRLIPIHQHTTPIQNPKQLFKQHLHKLTFLHNNFTKITQILNHLNIQKLHPIYYHLPLSTPQLHLPHPPFTYHHHPKLHIPIHQTQSLSPFQLLNQSQFQKLLTIFHPY
ncbi:16S rRNA (cytosine(1402)-N(4))-methyltransferase, partial [Staphylococcus saprophyticus]|uniref:16S rRNA (cytosine(1402)-N(4))-methyltransferase n=1 Tax=Staphylococcus saprophyticus TaxID=29385 RepID=UPI00124520B7